MFLFIFLLQYIIVLSKNQATQGFCSENRSGFFNSIFAFRRGLFCFRACSHKISMQILM